MHVNVSSWVGYNLCNSMVLYIGIEVMLLNNATLYCEGITEGCLKAGQERGEGTAQGGLES
jgi:hypothetical protein